MYTYANVQARNVQYSENISECTPHYFRGDFYSALGWHFLDANKKDSLSQLCYSTEETITNTITVTMHSSLLPSLALICSLSPLAASTPLASKHNLYLATCTPPRECLLIICDTPDPFTAAAYYANGASATAKPTELATIADPASPWEGASRKGSFRNGVVTSTINVGAKALAKGELAGEAKLGTEEFVCFRDGQSKFTTTAGDGFDRKTVSCVADYWCASTS